MVASKNTGRPAVVQIQSPGQAPAEPAAAPAAGPAPRFEYWDTPKLAQMTRIARQRVAEAQARFEAIGAVERRRGKRTWGSEDAADHVRRAEDTLNLMRAELRRRSLAAGEAAE